MSMPAILLAAGASRRLGSPKQLVQAGSETMIHRLARIACTVCGPVIVVLGSEGERVRDSLAGLPVRCIQNLDWEEGMASSIRAGITALPLDAQGVLLLVCDQPAVDEALLQTLCTRHQEHPSVPVACAYGGGRGIPAIFPRTDFDRLLALRGDRGAKALLQAEAVQVIPFEPGIWDLDTPEDLERLGELRRFPG